MRTVETARDRRTLAQEAGYGATSWVSVLAGTLVAFGAVALVMAIAGAVGNQLGFSTEGISTSEWRDAGMAGAAVAAVVLLIAFFFGGYTAGRMGRRSGVRHGLLVFVLAAVAIAVVAGLAAALGDTSGVRDSLTGNGVPVDGNTWSDIGIGAGIAALAAMLIGSLLGGMRGDRWHGRLVTAAVENRNEATARETRRPELGDDPTTSTAELRDDRDDRDVASTGSLSVEEERERARQD
jgi:hypothetical protein